MFGLGGTKLTEISPEKLAITADSGMVFSQTPVDAARVVYGVGEKGVILTERAGGEYTGNVLALGNTRSGKTACLEAPTILNAIAKKDSVLVMESSKADLFQRSGKAAADAGYQVLRVDLRSRLAKEMDDDADPVIPGETVIRLADLDRIQELDPTQLTQKLTAWYIILPDQDIRDNPIPQALAGWYQRLAELYQTQNGDFPVAVTIILADAERILEQVPQVGASIAAMQKPTGGVGHTVLSSSGLKLETFQALFPDGFAAFPLVYILGNASPIGQKLMEEHPPKSILEVKKGRAADITAKGAAAISGMADRQELLLTQAGNAVVLDKRNFSE